MALRVYNTKTRAKEEFHPLEKGKVGMYVCGVTVYDTSHIGHARCYVAFDVIYRFLKHVGYDVSYVRNFTDVDDKIIKRAAELGCSTTELADRNIALFREDMEAMGCLQPDIEPRVTEHIPHIIALVEKIIGNGHAYVADDGSVYFSIDTFADYLSLSGRNLDDMVAGASDRVGVDPNKRNPLDFVLWKPSKEGEPSWDSPWGTGRPGWHIECSAMSAEHLGETFDIHGGGKDLVFPHHENEIAQSTAASGKEFVRYWMHNGFVDVDQEKMSKSLGNFFTIREVAKLYHPEALRTFLLSTHYRSPINYSDQNLAEATGRIHYMYQTLATLDAAIEMGGNEGDNLYPEAEKVRAEIVKAMSDDFNAAAALGHLFELFRAANEFTRKKRKLAGRITTLRRMRKIISEAGAIFGILEREPATVLAEIRERDVLRLGLDVSFIESKIEARIQARKDKNFAAADAIRDELQAINVALMDSPTGTEWGIIRAQKTE
jgi:cysteinyl-tRNA synthetase